MAGKQSNEKQEARDDDLVEFIDAYLDVHRYAPTFREVGKAFNLSSSSSVHQWLKRLRREDRIDWVDGETRTLHTVSWETERH